MSPSSRSKVVVTGGAGFVGAHVVRKLAASPHVSQVTVLDDLSTGYERNLDGVSRAELVVGSILDASLVAHTFRGADSIVHLAARPSVPRSIVDPVAAHTVNATGTVAVLEAARASAVPHVVVASSSSVYGANSTLPKREDLTPQPVSPYAASKLASESYAIAWGHSYGLATLAFRFFNVFGPFQPANHDYAAVIPAFVTAALDGEPLQVFGDGQQTRDFTYVENVADVVVDAVVRRVASSVPVNLALGSRLSLLEVVRHLEKILSTSLVLEHRPERIGDVRHSQADVSSLRALFPDVPAVDFITGLQRTVEWTGAQRHVTDAP